MKNIQYMLLLGLLFYCQCHIAQTSTPQEYINHVLVSDSIYQKDSLWLVNSLAERLRDKSGSFYNKEYFDSTQIFIDSIIYNEDNSKIAFFVITKNPMYRRLYKIPSEEKYDFYYDAYCYLGKRSDSLNVWNTHWFKTLSLSNYYDYKETSERIRWKYFNELVKVKDTSGVSAYKYNVNDIRFWDCPAWNKVF